MENSRSSENYHHPGSGQRLLAQQQIYSNENSPQLNPFSGMRNKSDRPQYHPLPSDLSRSHRRITAGNLLQIPDSSNNREEPVDKHEKQEFESPPLDPAALATIVSSPTSLESDNDGLFISNINSPMGKTPEFPDSSVATPQVSPQASGTTTPHNLKLSDMASSNFDASCLATLGKDASGSISIRVDSHKRAKNLLRRLEGKGKPQNGGVLGNLIRLHSVMTGNRNDRLLERNDKHIHKPHTIYLPQSKSWTKLPKVVQQSFRHLKPTTPDLLRPASMVDVRDDLQSTTKSSGQKLPKSMSSARMSALMMTPEAFARNGIIPPPSTHSSLRMNEKLSSGYFDSSHFTVSSTLYDERAELLDTIAQVLEKQDFIMHLARAWHAFGSPVHRMEANLLNVANYLNIEACFFSVPGLTLISFGDPDTHSSETHIVRASDGYDMYRLEQVNRISRQLRKGKASVHESIRDIEALMAKSPVFTWYLRLGFNFVQSFFVSMTLFHGTWREAALAGGLSIFVGAFELISSRYPTAGCLLNVVPPLIVALVTALLSEYVCFAAVPMAAIINLLPGLGLALAMMELSSSNVICGAVRLVSATMTSFMLGWSTIVGYNLGMAILGKEGENTELSNQCSGLTMLWWILFLPLTTTGFSVWFKVHWKQWPATIFAGSIGLVVQSLCNRVHVMTNISAGVASFAVGLFSNIYGNFTHSASNASIVFVGIIQLVPGSTGVQSFISYMSSDSSASTLTMNMLTSAIGIAVGLILSNSAIYSELKRFRLGSF
ncbi:pheromone-regulated protein prm10 [Coemansia brasiliensis]|uniref:Pheromone-regulated protein prm10 n=1 Tax=Coemansia brasiliensis TaxID=2650707 RepID=A0A9W8M162_9FUNG|nr:pheromone-regulated protein prm10 [Coemansia brasiliensis]